jgi:hypothetical protein
MIEQAKKDVQAELLLADTADPKPVLVNDSDAGDQLADGDGPHPPVPKFAQVMEGGVHDRVMAFAQVTDSVTNSVTNSTATS